MADDDDDDDDADDDDVEDGEDDEDGEEDGESSKGGNKKLLIIVGALFLLVVGGAAAAYFAGLLQPVIDMVVGEPAPKAPAEGESPAKGKEGAAPVPENTVFHDLTEILVNLNTGGRKQTFLKIKISLELANETDVPIIDKMMPRIIDNFQVYLRELRVDDLKGSAGMYRLREELLTRVNAAVSPAKVNDVLFKEMLIQ